MNPVQVIGDLLTNIDTSLAREDFKPLDPNWQLLYALRKHVDDRQRRLVTLHINLKSDPDKSFAKISAVNAKIAAVINDPSKVGDVIKQTAEIAAHMDDFFLRYKEPDPEPPPKKK